MDIYRVAEVAKKLGISKQTLLRYEKKGVFPKGRRNRINRWREYTDKDIQKMAKILGRGFTLIEFVMVIVIVGILAALTIPRFESFYSIKLNGAVKKVVSDIRYVQQLALSRHANCKIVFSPTPTNTYTAQEESGGTWIAITDPFTRANLQVNFNTDPQYRGINISSTTLSGNTLRFNWEGIPQEGPDPGVTDLTVERLITLEYRGNNLNIYITPNTGRVRIQ